MKVKKRDGTLVPVRLDEITDRITNLCNDLDIKVVDPMKITIEVIEKMKDNMSTSELDTHAAEICHAKTMLHPHFNVLASRLIVSDHHKNCKIEADLKFSNVCKILYNNLDQVGKQSPLISHELYEMSQTHSDIINNMVVDDRDFLFDYFGFKTLYNSYLIKCNGKVIETPQHMIMRNALGHWGKVKTQEGKIYEHNFDRVKETYDLISQKYFTHATPNLYNAGTPNPQLISCFLLGIDDSLNSIYKTLADCAQISKWSGGIGLHVSDIRGQKSYIRGTGGNADGLEPMLKVYNDTAVYVNQGGRRPGSFAIYVEQWHPDIEKILEYRLPTEEYIKKGCGDLFYAMWTSDLFMKRVEKNQNWSLMCPSECPGLSDVYGNDFKKLYEKYESEGKVRATVKAIDIWNKIMKSQIESGGPYMLYKDAVNLKSNQKNVGTIKSSNLCCEINEYSDTSKYACCVLASVVLAQYVKKVNGSNIFDHNLLYSVVRVIVRNLNRVIDINFYPVPETRVSNESERPLGLGVQGLADVFFMMKYPYDSKEALTLDSEIFETIYFAAITESVELAKIDGPYSTFKGSPLSKGEFQFDLWEKHSGTKIEHSGRWDWNSMRKEVIKHGTRNSLLLAPMPTASTGQIMGSAAEAFEPITSNAYARNTNAGSFILLNKYLTEELIKLGIWDDSMKNSLLKGRGSLKNIKKIPDDIKKVYKTVWEIKQKILIDHSVARGVYIDQSQSLNLFFESPTYESLTKAHFYGWKQGLKTGSYYIRSKPEVKSASFTYESDKEEHTDHEKSDHEEPKKTRRKKKTEVEVTELPKIQVVDKVEAVEEAIDKKKNEDKQNGLEKKVVFEEKGLVINSDEGCDMCGS